MNRKSRKILPFAVLGVSVIALLVVFVLFMLKDTGKSEIAKTEPEVIETESKAVEADSNLENAEGTAVSDSSEEKPDSESTSSDDVSAEVTQENSEGSFEQETIDVADASNESSTVEEQPKDDKSEDQTQSKAAEEQPQTEEPVNEQPQSEEPASEQPQPEAAPEAQAAVATPHTGGHLIVIDPGHQSKAMTDKEPNGPGSDNMKMKVTAGTAGKTTGLAESQLNLTIGLMLRDELTNRGYTVVMTRESQDVSLSNVDRAQIANNAGAEAFIRIHANGSDDTSVNGALTICQTPSNPYNGGLHDASRKLSDSVLDAYCSSTGFKKQYVWETDTMTGINWANVPSTIIEMGYMSNPSDDTNMASPDYQKLMTIGIANGIDNYFAN